MGHSILDDQHPTGTQIARVVEAGSNRAGDALLILKECELENPQIEIETPYESMFGPHLREIMANLVQESGLSHVCLRVEDHGAWDYVLGARWEAVMKKWGSQL